MQKTGLIPGSGRSPGVRNGNLLQYSCLENSMDRGVPGGLQSMGSQRVRHNWVTEHTHTLTHTHTHTIFNETPLSLSPPTLKFLQPYSLYYSVIRIDIWKRVFSSWWLYWHDLWISNCWNVRGIFWWVFLCNFLQKILVVSTPYLWFSADEWTVPCLLPANHPKVF